MNRKTGNLGFAAATVLLIFVTALSFVGTAMSRTDFNAAELEGYYREEETRLVEDTRAYLNDHGLKNSGVMLTRVVEADGRREYTVTVHHRDIDEMTLEEREALALELAELDFSDESCVFFHEFLLSD